MRLTRFVAGVLSASLLGLAPLALGAGAAQAADYTTVTTLDASRKLIEFKGIYKPYISGAVKDSSGRSVYSGTVTLEAKPGAKAWRAVATQNAGGYVSFTDVVPKQNTQYRLTYSGGSNYSDTFQSSSSGTLKIKVARKLTIKSKSGRRVKVTGKVAPKYSKKKVHVHKKVGKKWKKVRTVRTNKKSRFNITMPAAGRKPTKYRFTVPGNKKFVTTRFVGTLRRI